MDCGVEGLFYMLYSVSIPCPILEQGHYHAFHERRGSCWCGPEKVMAVAQTCLSQQGSSLKSQHVMQGPNFKPIMQGPNFTWHLDGYDKVSHFHFLCAWLHRWVSYTL